MPTFFLATKPSGPGGNPRCFFLSFDDALGYIIMKECEDVCFDAVPEIFYRV